MGDKLKPETARRFGTLLQQAREAQGLSQAGLGERLGVGQAQVSNVESGANVRLSTLENFARYLGYEVVLVPRARLRDVAAVSAAPSFAPSLFSVSPSALQAITGTPTEARTASHPVVEALRGDFVAPSGGRALPFDMPRGSAFEALASAARPLFAAGGAVDDDDDDDRGEEK